MARRYKIFKFDKLTGGLLYDILRLRAKVFVVEQHIIYLDLDGYDRRARHLCLFDGKRLIAYARILPPKTKFDEPSIGRIVVSPRYRGKSVGKNLTRRAIRESHKAFGKKPIVLEAQEQRKEFYEDLGFKAISDVYDLEGIPHIKMRRTKRTI